MIGDGNFQIVFTSEDFSKYQEEARDKLRTGLMIMGYSIAEANEIVDKWSHGGNADGRNQT